MPSKAKWLEAQDKIIEACDNGEEISCSFCDLIGNFSGDMHRCFNCIYTYLISSELLKVENNLSNFPCMKASMIPRYTPARADWHRTVLRPLIEKMDERSSFFRR